MKQSYFLFAAVALSLSIVGCSSDDTTQSGSGRFGENEIGFLTSTTRAEAIDIYDGFEVYATSGSSPEEYFIPQGAYNTDDSGVTWYWDGTSYDWPESVDDFPVNFYAYAPVSDLYTITVTEDPSDGMTSEITIAEADSQIDIVSATTSATSTPVGGKISLEFQHILSRLALSTTASVGSTVYIQSISFVNLMETNTYDFMGQVWDDINDYTDATISYSYYDLTEGGSYELAAATTENIGSHDANLILMPQECQPWDSSTDLTGARVEVVFRVIDSSTSDDYLGYTEASDHPDYLTSSSGVDADSPLFIRVGFPLSQLWDDGKSYTYTLTLGSYGTNNGYYVSEYYYDEDGDETDLSIDDAEVGDEVTDEEICFAVTVAGWGGGGTTAF